MAHPDSKFVVYAAIVGNFAIAVTKFTAAAFTGSSAILTEGIHSIVDTGNGLLLLLGIRLSKRPADEQHPFGHGAELYFWPLIVAMLIFGVGGGVSIYEGIMHLLHPSEVTSPVINYIVLALAAVFEGIAWWIAMRSFMRTKRYPTFWESFRHSKDPTNFMVLFEDSAALLGLLVAFVGLALGQWLDSPYMDGAASILIGVILCVVALVLIYETRGLLIGESADPDVIASIREITAGDEAVVEIRNPLTLHLGPNQVLLAVELQFRDQLSADQVADAIDRVESAIRKRHPQVSHIFLEAESITAPRRSPKNDAGPPGSQGQLPRD